jgi:hypothetical protein
MRKSVTTFAVVSVLAAAMAGASMGASADEKTVPHPEMMQESQGAQGSYGMPGYGMGMMGGYGPGYGMGQGMGGGYGPGSMMGGYGGGFGMGPGMGMMGSGCSCGMPGSGMGPGMGMMGGGMGSGMMGGWAGRMGPMAMLDLSDAQNAQLERIQGESMKKQRSLMHQVWGEQEKLWDLFNAEKRNPAAIGKGMMPY